MAAYQNQVRRLCSLLYSRKSDDWVELSERHLVTRFRSKMIVWLYWWSQWARV